MNDEQDLNSLRAFNCAVGSRLTVHIGCGIYHIGSDSLDSVECRARMMSHVGLVTKG